MNYEWENKHIFLYGVCLYWFSLFDVMDGMRARRLKAGSPLGRLIDEGLDLLAYSNFSLAILFMLRVDPGYVMLLIGLVNAPFYCMEVKHLVCRTLIMIMGEIGSVEGMFI